MPGQLRPGIFIPGLGGLKSENLRQDCSKNRKLCVHRDIYHNDFPDICQCSIQIPAAHVAVLYRGDRDRTICHSIPCRSIGCSQEPIPPGAGLLYRLHAGKGEESAFCRGNGAGDHPVRNDVLLWGADGASGDVS